MYQTTLFAELRWFFQESDYISHISYRHAWIWNFQDSQCYGCLCGKLSLQISQKLLTCLDCLLLIERKMEKHFFHQHQRHLSAYGQTNVCPSFACAAQDLSRCRYLFGSTYNEVAEFGIWSLQILIQWNWRYQLQNHLQKHENCLICSRNAWINSTIWN